MIVVLLRQRHRYTMDEYLQSWGQALASRIKVLPYEELGKVLSFPAGTCIFTDLERLTPAQTALAVQMWDQLAAGGVRLFNHPRKALRRFELLRHLHQAGGNRFNVYRAARLPKAVRLPAFFRENYDHNGNLTPLLQRPEDVRAALVEAALLGFDLHELLLVEYCHTADAQGIFRKYAALKVGDRILPRNVFFSKDWMVKLPDLLDPPFLEEQQQYLQHNPHEQPLRQIFAVAGIDYGRIDYSVVDGRIQVWEINTNPRFLQRREDYKQPALLPVHQRFAEVVGPALEELDGQAAPAKPVPIRLSVEAFAAMA
jgi:hypothetical protein